MAITPPSDSNIFSDIAADPVATAGPQDTVEAVDEAALDQEIAYQKQYGDSSLRTGLESAASAATLGLSDVMLADNALSRQGLKERRDRNPVAAGVGTAVGTIVPALIEAPLLPGTVAMKAGALTEKAIASRMKNGVARKILEKAAGGATEGALYGLGNLTSEAALGNADFNGENIVASAGAGALLGAGFGGALGAVNATVPLASKTFGKLGKKLTENTESLLDDVGAAKEMSGLSLGRKVAIEDRDPNFFKELPQYYRDKLKLNAWTDPSERAAANKLVLEKSGNDLAKIHKTLDEVVAANPAVTPPRSQMYQPLIDKIEAESSRLAGSEATKSSEIKVLQDFKDDLISMATKDKPFSYKEFDNLRKNYQTMKFSPTGAAHENFKANIADSLRAETRKSIDAMAQRISTAYKGTPVETIAKDLKAANRDFYIASTLDVPLLKRAEKKAGLSWADTVEAGAATQIAGAVGGAAFAAKKLLSTDLRRNAVILWDIKRQYEATKKLALDSVDSFFKATRKPARAASLRALVSSGFSMSEDKKAPKNAQVAFENVSKNLMALQSNPEFLVERLAKTTARIDGAAPATAAATQATLIRAVDFLNAKLPRPIDSGSGSLFPKKFTPSSLQLAKFERYLQVVEHPLSILEDLEKGVMTREHVEALKAVYPSMYTDLQNLVVDKITKDGDQLSYSKKLALGILLDVPTDESLEPSNIAGLQATFAAQNTPQDPAQQSGTGVSGSKAKSLNMADRASTGTQKVANRA